MCDWLYVSMCHLPKNRVCVLRLCLLTTSISWLIFIILWSKLWTYPLRFEFMWYSFGWRFTEAKSESATRFISSVALAKWKLLPICRMRQIHILCHSPECSSEGWWLLFLIGPYTSGNPADFFLNSKERWLLGPFSTTDSLTAGYSIDILPILCGRTD